ncbi:MAG TPA: hypothetical protein VGP07_02690 [Polyangia bacterium]
MPVRKFRDVSEIEEPRYEPGSRQLYEVIRHVWGLSDLICPLRFPEGVFRHRTIEDAEALRAKWEDDNFQAHRARMAANALR